MGTIIGKIAIVATSALAGVALIHQYKLITLYKNGTRIPITCGEDRKTLMSKYN